MDRIIEVVLLGTFSGFPSSHGRSCQIEARYYFYEHDILTMKRIALTQAKLMLAQPNIERSERGGQLHAEFHKTRSAVRIDRYMSLGFAKLHNRHWPESERCRPILGATTRRAE